MNTTEKTNGSKSSTARAASCAPNAFVDATPIAGPPFG